MNGEVVKEWLIAELNAITLSNVDSVLSAGINNLPSKKGVYVSLGNGVPVSRNISGDQEVRLIVVQDTEKKAHINVNELHDAINHTPGENKNWQVDPFVNHLRIQKIDIVTVSQPQSSGIANALYTAVIVLSVSGRDMRRT